MSRGWDKLLKKSMRGQDEKLLTNEFVSISEAAQLLKVQPRTVQRRVRECSLLALRGFAVKEYRIPAWTLSFKPGDTAALMAVVGDSHWHLYQFLQAPMGFGVLTPAHLLVDPALLSRWQREAREDLVQNPYVRDRGLISVIIGVLEDQLPPKGSCGFG